MNNRETPLLSICCIAYNHENYIRNCLEGFLLQKVDFPIEILIFDDASTDNTQKIIKEFERKDNRIITFLQKDNQWNQGKYGLLDWLFPAAQGKYMALCEGDDYWIDPLKLQKQVDFMEANTDCALVFHLANYINDNYKILGLHGPKIKEGYKVFDIKDAILQASTLIPTNAMLFQAKYVKDEFPVWFKEAPVGDVPLTLLLARKGKLGFINEVMSNYRVMTPESWSKQMQLDRRKRINHFFKIKKMWKVFNKWSKYEYNEVIENKLKKHKLIFCINELKLIFPLVFNLLKKIKNNG